VAVTITTFSFCLSADTPDETEYTMENFWESLQTGFTDPMLFHHSVIQVNVNENGNIH